MADDEHDGILPQLLAQQTRMADKQAEMATNVALVRQRLEDLPVADHEKRLRALEQAQAEQHGSRDVLARLGAALAVVAAIAATVADYLHH